MSRQSVVKLYGFTDSDLVYINNALHFYSTLSCSKTFYVICSFEPDTHKREGPGALMRSSAQDTSCRDKTRVHFHDSVLPPHHCCLWFIPRTQYLELHIYKNDPMPSQRENSANISNVLHHLPIG